MMLVYTTCKTAKDARRIADHLLSKRLIACANSFPITSAYNWKGKAQRSKEHAIYLKTTDKAFPIMRHELEKIHPYECPCILQLTVTANEKYDRWVRDEVR